MGRGASHGAGSGTIMLHRPSFFFGDFERAGSGTISFL